MLYYSFDRFRKQALELFGKISVQLRLDIGSQAGEQLALLTLLKLLLLRW